MAAATPRPGANIVVADQDPANLTIGEIIRRLKPAQAYAILSAVLLILTGAITLGSYIHSIKSDFDRSTLTKEKANLEMRITDLANQVASLQREREDPTAKQLSGQTGGPQDSLADWERKYNERTASDSAVRDLRDRILSGQTGTKSVVVNGKTFQIGDKITVPKWQWVDVLNRDAIKQEYSNGTESLGYGGTCGIDQGGFVEILGFQVEKGSAEALVKYTAPGKQVGTPCPTGVIFLQPL